MEEYISDNSVYARAKSNSMINPKMIGRVLGTLLFIELGMFLLCAGISLGYGEDDYKYFLYTCVINAVDSYLLYRILPTCRVGDKSRDCWYGGE